MESVIIESNPLDANVGIPKKRKSQKVLAETLANVFPASLSVDEHPLEYDDNNENNMLLMTEPTLTLPATLNSFKKQKLANISIQSLDDSDSEDESTPQPHYDQRTSVNNIPLNTYDKSITKLPRKSSTWTAEMDARLREAAILHDCKWILVAEHVPEKTPDQCYNRWARYVNPIHDNVKRAVWTQEEAMELNDLVSSHHRLDKNGTMIVAWSVVSKAMNRSEIDCQNKFRHMAVEGRKKGIFSEEEDRIIEQRVNELNGRPENDAFWVRVADELNRVKFSVRKRWEALQKLMSQPHYKRPIYWTEEMDAVLIAAIEEHGTNWKVVADVVGGGVNGDSVRRRWKLKCDPALHAEKTSEWTDEEVTRLMEIIPSYRKFQINRDITDWQAVGKELNRSWIDCKRRERKVLIANMRHGVFTPQEDAIILERVAEWQGKGQGVWVALERELNRSSPSIQARWVNHIGKLKGNNNGNASNNNINIGTENVNL